MRKPYMSENVVNTLEVAARHLDSEIAGMNNLRTQGLKHKDLEDLQVASSFIKNTVAWYRSKKNG